MPAIQDNDFNLGESVAILHYLGRKGVMKSLYPAEEDLLARMNEYLEWQHLNTRANCSTYFLHYWLKPLMSNKPADEGKGKEIRKRMEKTLDEIENLWIGDKKFIAGDKLTAADIFAACELEQPSKRFKHNLKSISKNYFNL